MCIREVSVHRDGALKETSTYWSIQYIGVNISETKKRHKADEKRKSSQTKIYNKTTVTPAHGEKKTVFVSPPECATGAAVHRVDAMRI